MVNAVFYIFFPTAALSEAVTIAKTKYLAEVSVWSTKEHDRVGQEHTRTQIEYAFWTIFLAKLVGEDPEPALISQLRETCLKLRFAGCWSVVCTKSGGPAAELIDEASDAEAFVRQHVFHGESSGGKKT